MSEPAAPRVPAGDAGRFEVAAAAAPTPSAPSAPLAITETPSPAPLPVYPSAPAICGRMPRERIERVPWPHGSGNAKCDALETRWANVPHVDRACRSDGECTVVVSDGNCIQLPLTRKAAERSEYQTPPCGNPMSGACAGGRVVPRCANGCCVAGEGR